MHTRLIILGRFQFQTQEGVVRTYVQVAISSKGKISYLQSNRDGRDQSAKTRKQANASRAACDHVALLEDLNADQERIGERERNISHRSKCSGAI